MRAMLLTGLGQMEMREVPEPRIEDDNDVLVQLASLGVCGSDIHYYKTGRIGSQVVQYPYAVGHECAGTVVEVGPGVENLKPGDRVAIDPAMHCGHCDQCLCGRPHTCRNLRFLGCPGQADGSLCDFIVMPEGSLFPIKDSMTMQQAALSEPLSIGVYACKLAERLMGGLADRKIGILGFGPIGMSVLLPAVHYGAGTVYVTDKIPARLEKARELGVAWTGNAAGEDCVAGITEAEPQLLDAVFECCGEQEALDDAIEMLKPGGVLLLIGIPEVDRVSFSIDKLRRKEVTIQNVRRQNGCVQEALDLIDSGAVDVDAMVTHTFRFDQSVEAFDLVMGYRDGVMKAVIDW